MYRLHFGIKSAAILIKGVDISINHLTQSAKTTSPSTATGEPLLITNGLMSIS